MAPAAESAVTTSPPPTPTPTPPRVVRRPALLLKAEELDSATTARVAALTATGLRVDAAEVGYYLDVQEARLRQIGGDRVLVTREGALLSLRLPAQFAFAVGSADLVSEAAAILADVGKVLADFRASLVVVMGHTDSTGAAAVNQALSEQRAVAVARQLELQGVAQDRLMAIGYGSDRPIGDNATAVGRERNRRVELRIELIR